MAKPQKLTEAEQELVVFLANCPEPESIHGIADIYHLSTEQTLNMLARLSKSLRIYRNKKLEISLAIDPDAITNQENEIPTDETL
ncbi:MAG: hypothetical protein KJ593_07600 [Candidatus Omnitrophica bacterium]|nr:hypothetical protein [Candidatus Omnitrophota bacterium]